MTHKEKIEWLAGVLAGSSVAQGLESVELNFNVLNGHVIVRNRKGEKIASVDLDELAQRELGMNRQQFLELSAQQIRGQIG